jgi:hypothetical protein
MRKLGRNGDDNNNNVGPGASVPVRRNGLSNLALRPIRSLLNLRRFPDITILPAAQ